MVGGQGWLTGKVGGGADTGRQHLIVQAWDRGRGMICCGVGFSVNEGTPPHLEGEVAEVAWGGPPTEVGGRREWRWVWCYGVCVWLCVLYQCATWVHTASVPNLWLFEMQWDSTGCSGVMQWWCCNVAGGWSCWCASS